MRYKVIKEYKTTCKDITVQEIEVNFHNYMINYDFVICQNGQHVSPRYRDPNALKKDLKQHFDTEILPIL
jgi:hypothetical protein